jgi:hypothetical protein
MESKSNSLPVVINAWQDEEETGPGGSTLLESSESEKH